jgi:SAM-dependent methyltransferase
MPSHRDQILDQFSRQAIPFSTAPPIRDERALQLIVDAARTGADDTVLDVACGPGLVACAFARTARQVTGIDLTPAMIARAEALAGERAITNVRFQVGDVLPLPFDDAAFSIVVSRLLHHSRIRQRSSPRCGAYAASAAGRHRRSATSRSGQGGCPTAWKCCATCRTRVDLDRSAAMRWPLFDAASLGAWNIDVDGVLALLPGAGQRSHHPPHVEGSAPTTRRPPDATRTGASVSPTRTSCSAPCADGSL